MLDQNLAETSRFDSSGLAVCACARWCVQGELRSWDLAPLLFNEHLWRWQVHVQPFFYQLSSPRAGRPALSHRNYQRPLAKTHRQQQQSHVAKGRGWNTSEVLASHPQQPLKEA